MRYRLCNPYATGTIKTSTNAKSPIQAAKKLYTRISPYFSNNLPSFFFSLEDRKGKLHHFEVNERKSGDEANFTIRGVSMKKKGEKRLREIVSQQSGGKTKSEADTSSSSSSSSDAAAKAFHNWLYFTGYYMIDSYPVERYFFPVFVDTLVDFYPILIA